jgi:tRNA dimethylallyltransferase
LRDRVVFIVGPTAAGKTTLAVKLAKKLNGEIISADSMQAYKGMGIISQAPTALEQKSVKHHLISFLKPSDEYSASVFSRLAENIIRDIIRRKKVPIVVGGSGLYLKALLDGIFPSKGKNKAIRKRLEGLASGKGPLFLYNMLKDKDPVSAGNIHPNDSRRVIRALEIYEVDKKTKTSLKRETRGIEARYDIITLGLIMDRKKLYEKINKRVDLMFKNGLVKEVKRLLKRKLSLTSKQALGIKEIKGYFDKKYDLEKAKELLKKDTRRFAKRQLTWFRADKRIRWLDTGKAHGELEKIASGAIGPSQ